MSSPISAEPLSGISSTPELIWRIINWVERIVNQNGKTISHTVHNNHTDQTKRLETPELVMETQGSFTMFGGDNVKVLVKQKNADPKLVFDVDYWSSDNVKPKAVVDLETWWPIIEPDVKACEKSDRRSDLRSNRRDADIRTRLPVAKKLLKRQPLVNSLAFGSTSEIQRLIELGKEIGWAPSDENWVGETITLRLIDQQLSGVTINEKHPEFAKWKSLTLGSSLSFTLRTAPVGYITPEVMRWLELK